jgi:Asp-tRNA(Asn)/Glu-tRNA(Gln) amidotransferase A subunit family amidase
MMMPMISLAALQHRIASHDLSADAAIAQSLEAIGADDKTIGAFVCRDENAGAASTGPLRGIAVGIKDIIDTSDFPTEMGAAIYKARPRPRHSHRATRRQPSIRTTGIIRRADRRRVRRRRSRPEWFRSRWERRLAVR